MQDTDPVIQSLIVGGGGGVRMVWEKTTVYIANNCILEQLCSPFLTIPPHINILLTIALLITELQATTALVAMASRKKN